MNKTYIIGMIIAIVGVIGILQFLNKQDTGPSIYDSFAKCLGEKGAKFYGAFWCPHCAAQKKRFGSAKQFLPYNECSTPDATGQLKACTDLGIETYPTWIFANGEKVTGELELTSLAEKTDCVLPTSTSTPQ